MRRLVALSLTALAGCGEHGRASSVDGGVPDAPGVDAPVVLIDAAAGTLVATPSSLDFGSIPINGTTPSLSVTLVYRGGPGAAEAQVIQGPNASAFAFEGTGCTWTTDTCTTRLHFMPTTIGLHTADFVVTKNDATAVVALRGTGTQQASLQVSPSVHDYGAIGVGATTAWTFTVTNATGATTGALSASITGPDSTQFSKTTDTCTGTMVSAGSSCTVVVAFSPTSAATKTATLAVTGSPGGSVAASLLGAGSAGSSLVITPAMFDFGTVSQGNSSLGKMFTITNTASTSSGLVTTMMAGNHPGDFLKQFDQCNNHTLAPGVSCTLFITFEPGPTGTRNARLQAAASPGGFAAADLSGTCTP